MKELKLIYKKVNPVIGFTAESGGGTSIIVKIDGKELAIMLSGQSIYLSKTDAQSFINNLQKVVSNIEE